MKKSSEVKTHIVEDLNKQVSYTIDGEDNVMADSENKPQFLSEVTEYRVDEEIPKEDDTYEKLLNNVFPETDFLIQYMQKNMNGSLSVMDAITKLEPFHVYPEDVTYQQYNQIRYFMKLKMKEYKTRLATKSQEFSQLLNMRLPKNTFLNMILRIFADKKDFLEVFADAYRMDAAKVEQFSTSELLSKISETDNNVMFSALVSRMLLSLVTPNKLMDGLAIPEIDDMNKIDKIKPTDCSRRFLTKKYNSVTEMQKDNNVEKVFYDAEYDDSPYHILKKYSEQQKKMIAEDFVDYLAENLIQKHDCNPNMAKELAITLISGKKMVSDGEYAILELRPQLPSKFDMVKLTEKEKAAVEIEANARVKTQYYRRMKDHWVHDTNVNEESFMDTQSLFCNVEPKCYKNQTNNQCDPLERSAVGLHRISQEKLVKEMDKRFSQTVEEMEKELESLLETNRKNIIRNLRLKQIQLYKQNLVSYELGKQLQLDDIIVSPYAKLRDLILAQDDFVKKQHDICWLVDEYTREPMVAELKEDENWLYCKETNTKLFPNALYILAIAFVHGGNYQEKQAELCHSHGMLSDDGDSIVDKYSGYVLRKLDFSTDEEYDDAGFKITSHSIMEKDLATVISETLAKKVRIFDNETDQMVYNVFMALATNSGIPTESIEEFVLRVSLELIRDKSVILDEDAYKKRAEKSKNKDIIPIAYPIYRNQSILSIVGAISLVAAQCTIPSIKTRKTYPGCVKSFTGYPMSGGMEDVTGIKYIACVLNGTKSDQEPWNAITKLNVPAIAKRILDVVNNYVLKRNDVQDLYANKRNYLLVMPDEVVPQEHDIAKWKLFLPPLVDIGVTAGLRNVSSDFKKDLLEVLKRGNKSQHSHITMFQSKINAHVYGIIELIYRVVAEKDLLLHTASKKPFLENACCNEGDQSTHPLTYFVRTNPVILQYVTIINDLAKSLKDVRELSKASMFYHPASTWTLRPDMPSGQVETNIYAAFIHYCRYDRGLPVPEEFSAICGEKPAGYQSHWSIEEKTEFLKKNGKRFDAQSLGQLMDQVHHNNIITISSGERDQGLAMRIPKLRDFIQSMHSKDSDVIPHSLRQLLVAVLDVYRPREMKKEGSVKAIIDLRKYLAKTNENMLREITNFMRDYGNVNLNEVNKVQNFMANIHVWTMDTMANKNTMANKDSSVVDSLYTVSQFMKNSVEALVKTYPSMLLNGGNDNTVHKHWGLSNFHKQDIENMLDKYLEGINKYKKDKSLSRLLVEVQRKTVDLHLLLQNIPIETPIHRGGSTYFELFDKKTLYMLHVYCWYSVFYEYMKASMDDDLLQFDVEDIRQLRREQNAENGNPSNDVTTIFETDMEEMNELEDDLQQVEIRGGDLEIFQKRICSLMMAFLDIDQKNKYTLDKPYEKIARKVMRSKQEEKKTITDYLENMEKDERKVEDTLKQLKLGRWNVGIQKGIFMYDKGTYDNERNTNLARFEEGLAQEYVEGEMMDATIEDLEREEELANEEYDREGFDIGGFGDDYMDGNYNGDEGDDDFRED